MMVQMLALGVSLVPGSMAVLLAAPLCGFAGVGISAVALTASREQAGPAAGLLWARATAVYAAAQAISGFALAALFRATAESHAAVFGAALLVSAAGFAMAALIRRTGAAAG
jgi:hypothetical protein